MKARSRAFAAAFVTVALAATPTMGHAHSGTAAEQAACTGDVLSLCFFEIPNEDRIVACLNRKKDRLSEACRNVIDPPPTSKQRSKRQ